MTSVSITTVAAGGVHFHFHDPNAPDSVEAACEGPIADHINSRLASLDGVVRFVVVLGDLSWSVNVGLDQHLQYSPNATGSFPAVRAKG
jgi:hypothetical protein